MGQRSGDLVGERYRLGRQIGAGGMAAVFEALDVTLKRRVAAKFLTARNRNPATVERRFLREARIAAAVRHPNVVEVFDFGVTDDTPFMIMELLEGDSLAERTRRPPLLAVGELLDVIDGVLAGLTAIHEAGIVHRDLKPENIFLATGRDGAMTPKVFDFGVSKVQTEDGPISASTSVEGYLVGTPHYMSSEQARGLKDLTPATDVYSIGVVLYEHLVGRLPFDAEHMGDLVIAIATDTPKSVFELRPEVGRELSDLIERSMSKLPGERFESASAMREALRAVRDGHPDLDALRTELVVRPNEHLPATVDPPDVPLPWDDTPMAVDYGLPDLEEELPPPAPPTARPRPRPRWPALAVGGLAAVGLGVAGWFALGATGSTPTPPTGAPASVAPPPAPTPPRPATIRLEGLPSGARLLLDGEPATGAELSVERGDAEHRLEVEASGMEPFTTVFVANADRTLRVAMTPVAGEPPPVEPVSTPPSGRSRRGRGSSRRGGGGIFRTPDF
ncbi:MAG: serine/threonine protein kinase [Sandaracinaceae bacterium]|nr:serine/threonine protein kinase [Sandaracinaceae bacterium]